MKLISRILILFFFSVFFLPTFSQEDDKKIVTNQVWLDYYMYFYFKPKWEYYGDAGYRFLPKSFQWQTVHIRPSIRYLVNSTWEIHGGIGLFQTFNKNASNSFEIRPWQGVRAKWPSFDPVYFSHYFRLEERFFIPQGSPMEYNFRFRYRLGVKIYVYRSPNGGNIFIPGYAEAFVNFGKQIEEVFSNRARFAVGLGYKTAKEWTFEFHFVGQNAKTGRDEQFETADRLFQFKIRRHLFNMENLEMKTP